MYACMCVSARMCLYDHTDFLPWSSPDEVVLLMTAVFSKVNVCYNSVCVCVCVRARARAHVSRGPHLKKWYFVISRMHCQQNLVLHTEQTISLHDPSYDLRMRKLHLGHGFISPTAGYRRERRN